MKVYRVAYAPRAESKENSTSAFESIALEGNHVKKELFFGNEEEAFAAFKTFCKAIENAEIYSYVISVYGFSYALIECADDCDEEEDLKEAWDTASVSDVVALKVSGTYEEEKKE